MTSRYRFRVKNPDGLAQVSEIFEGPERDLAALLDAPQWGSADLSHGGRATITVKGTGLDGRMIKFVIEHKNGKKWEPYDQVVAEMKNGVATAELPVHHPGVTAGADADDADPATLRFYCKMAI